jgi:spore coat-associated protein N
MKRMKFLFGQRRMQVLLTLAVLLLAVSVVIGSGASFTAQKANAGNIFTAGNLAMSDSIAGPIVHFNTPVMRPGDISTGTVTISNTGDVPGAFTLTKSALTGTGSAALGAKLDLVIQEVDGSGVALLVPAVFNDKLDGAIVNKSLGTWSGLTGTAAALGATHNYKFTVTWSNSPRDDTGDNFLKSASASCDFTWDATADNTIN